MTDNTNYLKSSDELGAEVLRILGLPEHVRRFELVFEAQQPIIVKCEHVVWNPAKKEEIPHLLAEYELRKIDP